MLKPSLQNIINPLGIIAFLIVLGSTTNFAQNQEKPSVFYRVANLSPLGTQKLDVYLGEKSLALQTNSGFYMGYAPLDFKPGLTINLKSGDQSLQSVPLPDAKSTRFFTFLIVSDGSRPKLEILDDTPPEKTDETTGEKIPLKRLRVFSSAYQIPTKIEAGELLSWTSKTGADPMKAEKIFEDTQVNSIKVIFLDDQKMPVDLYFPLDFNTHDCNTVFISQRGPQRLRVLSYPDAVEPVEPTEENADVAAE